MDLKEFQELSKRTMPYKGQPTNEAEFKDAFCNYAIGLIGETMEFFTCPKDDEIKEVGDCLHYAVGLLTLLGEPVDMDKLEKAEFDGVSTYESILDILEPTKKHVFHGHELDKDKFINTVYVYIKGHVANQPKERVELVLQTNIEKLKTRYPNEFNSKDSIQRVDVNE